MTSPPPHTNVPPEFEVAFRATFDPLTRYVARRVDNPADVADVVASTYEHALMNWAAFDPHRGTHLGWIIGIARNLIAQHGKQLRRQALLQQRIKGRDLLAPDEFAQIDAMIDAGRLAPRIRSALQTALTDAERELFLMIHHDQLELADAARALGITPVAARMRLSRARRRVREHLADHTEPLPQPTALPHADRTLP